jgi:hypothetical protein
MALGQQGGLPAGRGHSPEVVNGRLPARHVSAIVKD